MMSLYVGQLDVLWLASTYDKIVISCPHPNGTPKKLIIISKFQMVSLAHEEEK